MSESRAGRHVLLVDIVDEPEATAAYEAFHAAGAVPAAIVASIRALYSTPSWFGTVSRTVSASWTAASRRSSCAITSGSPV